MTAGLTGHHHAVPCNIKLGVATVLYAYYNNTNHLYHTVTNYQMLLSKITYRGFQNSDLLIHSQCFPTELHPLTVLLLTVSANGLLLVSLVLFYHQVPPPAVIVSYYYLPNPDLPNPDLPNPDYPTSPNPDLPHLKV